MTDIALASVAAATAAGFTYTLTNPSDVTGQVKIVLSKPVYGGTHQAGVRLSAVGYGASTTAAETAVLAALNNQRGHRYGFGTTLQINKDPLGTVEVEDAS